MIYVIIPTIIFLYIIVGAFFGRFISTYGLFLPIKDGGDGCIVTLIWPILVLVLIFCILPYYIIFNKLP